MRRITLLLAALPIAASAQLAPPDRKAPTDEVVVATSAELAPSLRRVAAAFEAAHPGAHVRIEAKGSDVAMASLYTRRADIAVIGRDGTEPELKAYEWIYLRPPAARAVLRGSVTTPEHSPAVAVRVNAGNPIRSISMAQLAALFRPGGAEPNWGKLGVTGTLAARPVRIAVPKLDTGTGRFVRHAVLNDATQVAWQRVIEPVDARAIARAVAKDVGIIGLGDSMPLAGTRIVPIAVENGRTVMPGDAGYPLARTVMAYSHPADTPLAAQLLAFLTDSEGQRAATAVGPYRPIVSR